MDEDDIWLFLRGFKRIEAPGVMPYAPEEAIQRTLHALTLGMEGATVPERGETAEELISRGKALYAQKKRGEALSLFQRATELDPSSPNAWNCLYCVLGHLGRYQEALAAVERFIALDPIQANAWIDKADMLCDLVLQLQLLSGASEMASVVTGSCPRLVPSPPAGPGQDSVGHLC